MPRQPRLDIPCLVCHVMAQGMEDDIYRCDEDLKKSYIGERGYFAVQTRTGRRHVMNNRHNLPTSPFAPDEHHRSTVQPV